MELGLSHRSVLVTGGSGDIGSATARAFAAEGAKVAVTYRYRPEAAQAVVAAVQDAGGQALAVPYDLADPVSISQAVDAVAREFGGIDVTVFNAAQVTPHAEPTMFEDLDAAEWQAALRGEVGGAFHTAQAVVPAMKTRGWGRLVFLSSIMIRHGMTGEESFVTVKSALQSLSRTLATELCRHGVFSNVVAPGPVVSRGLLDRLPESVRSTLLGRSAEEIRTTLNASGNFPSRVSTPEDIAATVVFLGSAANGNINGQVVSVGD